MDYITQDNEPTLAARHRRSDAREIQSYYQQYYNDYVKALEQPEHSDRWGACFEECMLVREDTTLSRCDHHQLLSAWMSDYFVVYFHCSDFDSICTVLAPEFNLRLFLAICLNGKFLKNVEVKVF